MQQLFFAQPNVYQRLALLRVSVGLVCLILLVFGPYGSFLTEATPIIFSEPNEAAIRFLLQHLSWFTWIGMGAAACFALGIATRASGIVLLACWGTTSFAVAQFVNGPWSYNSHLFFFLAAMVTVECGRYYSLGRLTAEKQPSARQIERASAALSLMQIFVAVLYFQTGLSKLWHSGLNWFVSGQTAWVFAQEIGTPLGQRLAESRDFFVAGSVLTGIFELGYLPAFLASPRMHRPLAACAIGFHLTTLAILGISFWHLWTLFPALFFFKARTDDSNSVPHRDELTA